ncbi:hypothetical protein HG535_0A00440 [Zygotorulaspora mrakii]|uniref:Zn(2)-C6 fungal-type domain-containing protein n=1 Tax=Zygotorulaspora mrakii TaxID=42260 RepID=A0A7H9AV27_ZYGMR|nr:uncharacterized protein HG535_0A00440 [Zygotorulaspora mrakii]QLG70105.1 hypothetical protein HG535_0A00440 [Zygotorulaspora mrakii]
MYFSIDTSDIKVDLSNCFKPTGQIIMVERIQVIPKNSVSETGDKSISNGNLRQGDLGSENQSPLMASNSAKRDPITREINNERKPRKKRKTFSCSHCRRFKTRCDFEPLVGKCHRCNILQIECSLTTERESEILAAIEQHSKSAMDLESVSGTSVQGRNVFLSGEDSMAIRNPLTKTLNNRLTRLEDGFSSITSKIELMLVLLQGPSTSNDMLSASSFHNASVRNKQFSQFAVDRFTEDDMEERKKADSSSEMASVANSIEPTFPIVDATEYRRKKPLFLDNKFREPPLKLIRDLDERLFPRVALSAKDRLGKQQRPFVVARVNFLKFYRRHRTLCQNLSREFLVRSHFWIVPGGIKEIDDEYAERHAFITSVFTIIAMSFDDNDKYAEEQEVLYPLVERLLTNTLTMFEKLIAHDIEAIMYCCMFHISRKAKRHRQLQFNSLVLSDFALNSLLSIIDFSEIKERVLNNEEYDTTDLYHLRILNSLTACKLEYSVGYGSFCPLDDSIKELNNLTAKFPQSNFGDDIKVSEINLGDVVNIIFTNFRSFFESTKENFGKKTEGNGISENLIIFPQLNYWLKNWEELLARDGGGVLLFTFDFYHIMICRSFISHYIEELREQPEFLKGILNTMKEHSFSLLRGFLRLPPSLFKGAPMFTTQQLIYACLTLCDFLHWFDPSERQIVLNVCTRVYWQLNTIGEKLNEATDNVGKIIKSIIDTSKSRVNTGRLSNSFSSLGPQQTNEIAKEIEITTPKSVTSHLSLGESGTGGSFSMPDVEQFNSFEDFFQDFFHNLKPTTQKMFAAASSSQG